MALPRMVLDRVHARAAHNQNYTCCNGGRDRPSRLAKRAVTGLQGSFLARTRSFWVQGLSFIPKTLDSQYFQ